MMTVNLAKLLGSNARKQAIKPITAQEVPIIACRKVMPLSPDRSPPVIKSKKNLFSEDSNAILPCKIVAKKDIAAMLKAIVAVAGLRLKSFWKE
jgi:hypothetical protein